MSEKILSKYNVEIVEALILEIVALWHPEHLSARELILKIVSNPDDGREVETVNQAARNLREFGLFGDRDDEILEPTQAALRAVTLLTK